ncbi:MAG TPA: class I SAM-dependent methyltransferase [Ilumatobacteraceae bacterium]
MNVRAASRTAVLVCQGRAAAHDRIAPGRFDDPTAVRMLTDAERVPVEQVRSGVAPRTASERVNFEMVRACGELMAPRTIAIDDAIRDRPTAQLVVLGAGLDGRAWRMKDLAAIDTFEVDRPASQADKRRRVAALESVARSIQFVPVDFGTDDFDAALETAGHEGSETTTWVWEGVVPYLTAAEVEATVRVVRGRSASGSRLIVNYQMPSFTAVIGRLFARGLRLLTRQPDPLADEPRRSSWTPETMAALLQRHGFAVTRDDDLVSIARHEGIAVNHTHSLGVSRVAIADC